MRAPYPTAPWTARHRGPGSGRFAFETLLRAGGRDHTWGGGGGGADAAGIGEWREPVGGRSGSGDGPGRQSPGAPP